MNKEMETTWTCNKDERLVKAEEIQKALRVRDRAHSQAEWKLSEKVNNHEKKFGTSRKGGRAGRWNGDPGQQARKRSNTQYFLY